LFVRATGWEKCAILRQSEGHRDQEMFTLSHLWRSLRAVLLGIFFRHEGFSVFHCPGPNHGSESIYGTPSGFWSVLTPRSCLVLGEKPLLNRPPNQAHPFLSPPFLLYNLTFSQKSNGSGLALRAPQSLWRTSCRISLRVLTEGPRLANSWESGWHRMFPTAHSRAVRTSVHYLRRRNNTCPAGRCA